jgi:CRISPR-associated protein Cas1
MPQPYYIFSNGRLRRQQNTLFLERADESRTPGDDLSDDGMPTSQAGGKRAVIPVEQAEAIYCFGEVDINSKLVTFLAQQQVPVFFFDYYGNYTATLAPREYLHSGRLHLSQASHCLRRAARLRLAKAFVDAAIFNIQRVLKYYHERLDDDGTVTIARTLEVASAAMKQAAEATDIASLMGSEGGARQAYYETWDTILGSDSPFLLGTRQRHPPGNELNALVSFGNAMCYTHTLKQIYRTALDPTIGFLHEPGDRRFSLALDISEVFKPILVDRAIFRLVKTAAIQPKHFEDRLGGVYLTEAGRKIFATHWDERLRQTIQHRSLNRKVSYGHLVRLECYALVRHLLDPKNDPYEGFHMWW